MLQEQQAINLQFTLIYTIIMVLFMCLYVADRERSRQKNFQLILITHDMKFVEFIGRSGVVEKYSMVKKEIGLVLIWLVEYTSYVL